MSSIFGELPPLAWTQFWQVSLVALISLLVVRLFLKSRPHLAYVLLILVVVKCLTPPVWSSPLGVFSWSWETPASSSIAIGTQPILSEVNLILPPSKEATAEIQTQISPVQAVSIQDRLALNSGEYLLLVWVGGMVCLAVYLAVVWQRHLRIIHKTCISADSDLDALCQRVQHKIGLKRKVRLLVGSESYGPFCYGLLLPTIVIPEQLVEKVDPKNLETILAHELIHIRRGDTWIAMLQVLAGIIWWFHPLIWLVSRQMTRLREKCCDEEVVATTACNPEKYIQGILEVLKLNCPVDPAFLVSGIRSVDITKERMELIMSRKTTMYSCTPKFYWITLAALAMFVLPGQVAFQALASDKYESADKETKTVPPPASKEETLSANALTAATPKISQVEDNKKDYRREQELTKLIYEDDRFRLSKGEVLKFIPPNTKLEPLDELRKLHSDGNRNGWMSFHAAEGELRCKAATYGDDRKVSEVLRDVLGINLQYIKGDTEVLSKVLLGDWVFRRDPQKSHIIDPREVAVVEQAIAEEIGGDFQLGLQVLDLPVYEAIGDYKFSPLVRPDGNSYQIKGKVADLAEGTFSIPARRSNISQSVAWGFETFLDAWGEVLLTPIVDELNIHPEKHDFFLSYSRKGPEIFMEPLSEDDRKNVISHFTKQTGLALHKSTRPVQVLFVKRGKQE